LFKIKNGLLLLLPVFLVLQHAAAQICTGSLGDPVVNITFGTGPNPGPALSAQLPNLFYVSRPCPDDGFYTIVNSTSACFGDTWHTVPNDHTENDANGYMMLVNASFNSGDFYVDTVKGLCAGTTYEFAAWVTNVLKVTACNGSGISPNLTFRIESPTGAILGTYNTGNISQTGGQVWQQYGLFFTTPTTTSNVVLRITNNAPGGCGNDLALDDITFRPCGPTVTAKIAGTNSTTLDKCIDDLTPVILTADVSTGYNNPTYRWQKSNDGINWSDIATANTLFYQHLPSGTGKFYYRLSIAESNNFGDKNCRINSNELLIDVHALPGKGIGSNSPACTGREILLKGGAGDYFIWRGPNNFSSTQKDPVIPASLNAAGKYYMEASDSFGCKGYDSVIIDVFQSPVVQAPSPYLVCEEAAVILSASGGTTYRWFPASGLSDANLANPVATVKDTTVYTVIAGNGKGCFDSALVTINIIKNPFSDAGADKTIFEGESVQLNGATGGTNIQFNWMPVVYMVNSNTLTPTVFPTQDFTYRLEVTSSFGCPAATDSVFIRVYKNIKVPNAFSPNSDGVNDRWHIAELNTYPEADINVFDRYGKMVFKSRGYAKEWDGSYNGKPVPVGVYYYVIDLHNTTPVRNGSVTIIR
jgi:gliding motility-associated-like protein